MKTQVSSNEMPNLDTTVPWQQITVGGMISWAGNADSFHTGNWRSLTPVWLQDACKQCLLCFPVCPESAIKVDEQGKLVEFDYDHCKGCGVCANVCPFHAIEMRLLEKEGEL